MRTGQVSVVAARYDEGTYARFHLLNNTFVVFRATRASTGDVPLLLDDYDDQAIPSDADGLTVIRWTAAELDQLKEGHRRFGPSWSAILSHYNFRGRSCKSVTIVGGDIVK